MRGDSIGEPIAIAQHPKFVGGKKRQKTEFVFTDACPPFFIVISKVTQVLGGLRMAATASRSGRDSAGGSLECVREKEVIGESIVVLSYKG